MLFFTKYVGLWRSLCLMLAVFASGCRSGAEQDLSADNSELNFFPQNLAEPIKVIRQTSSEVLITVRAAGTVVSDVTLDGQPYSKIRIPGFSSSSDDGFPEIPSLQVLVGVPDGMTLAYDLLESEKDAPVRLPAPLAFQDRMLLHNGKTLFHAKNVAAYNRVFGSSVVEILEQSYATSEKVAVIKFYPIKYDGLDDSYVLTTYSKIRFYFTPIISLTGETPPIGGQRPSILSPILLNDEAATYKNAKRNYSSKKIDLMIAHETFKSALTRYVNFKKSRGRSVKEVYVSGKSADEIKALIKEEYASASPPATTMLVGNISLIPSFRGSGDNTWTDFDYQTLDQGTVPDIALGRIPAHNDQELNAFIDKAMARETATRNYDDILLTAGNDRALGCPTNVATVGKKFKTDASTVKIISGLRSNGTSSEEIYGYYNASPNIIVYDGHGNQQGMLEIPLVINNLGSLSNHSFPIILDIACLNANWSKGADQRNFAEKILFQPNAGAAGIMASGGSGNGHEFFQSIGSIMGSVRSKSASERVTLNEIGNVILAAKVKHGMQDRSYWNYYGDPATSIWESDADTINISDISSKDVKVGLSEGNSEATLYGAADQAKAMSFCTGSKAICKQFAKMEPTKTLVGAYVFASSTKITLKDKEKYTLKVWTNDGREFLKEFSLQGK
jgi:hypothetical protein